MSASMDLALITQYKLQHELLLKSNEPAWLKQIRARAFDSFIEQGIPNTQWENWKYTPLRLWHKNNFHHTANLYRITQVQEIKLFSILDEKCHDIVFIDGVYYPELSTQKLPEGVIAVDYQQAIKKHASAIEPYWGQIISHKGQPFASLCEALAKSGLVLIVPDNTVITQPIHVLYVSSSNSQNCANHLRNLFVLGKNSKAQIIEHYADLSNTSYFNNVITEIFLEDNAHLNHYKIEQEGNHSFHIGCMQVKQKTGSHFNSHAVTLSGLFSRHDMHTSLSAPNSSCQMNGFYFTRNNQHVDYHTLIEHAAAHCTSQSLYKGILADRSVSVFNGKVVVNPGALKTLSQQENHNLLLSTHCEANSKPELEIYADDVKCAHGATTGQLDNEALFFLQSRGLAYLKARRMLIRAFANQLFNQMPSESVRSYCQRYLEMAAYE